MKILAFLHDGVLIMGNRRKCNAATCSGSFLHGYAAHLCGLLVQEIKSLVSKRSHVFGSTHRHADRTINWLTMLGTLFQGDVPGPEKHRKDTMTNLCYLCFDSPVGRLKLVAGHRGLVAVLWSDEDPKRVPLEEAESRSDFPWLVQAAHELAQYFAGDRRAFTVPLDLRGTLFQKHVWTALLAIPFGEMRTYGQIARQIGKPEAVRAVGAANGRNPISIIVPCHRVIGASGALTGFAGGMAAKSYLLRLEGATLC